MKRPLPALYLITDRKQIPCGRDFLTVLENLLQLGVRMIQLREKDLSAAELYPIASELRTLTQEYNALLLINDRIDIAQAVNADGVHLGNHSLPVSTARRILGSTPIIGASAHSYEEARSAESGGADFITFGPVFHTPSKAAFGTPAGIDALSHICRTIRIPVYALGGVNPTSIKEVRGSGAYGAAFISALIASEHPETAYNELVGSIQSISQEHDGGKPE